MSLKNKTIILSFDSKGITIALVLATLYTNIRFVASGQNEPKEPEKLVSGCSVFVFNMSDESLVKTATKEKWPSFGFIDFMKNNAVYAVSGSVESISAVGFTDKYNMNQPKNMVINELIIHSLNQEF